MIRRLFALLPDFPVSLAEPPLSDCEPPDSLRAPLG